MKAFIKKQFNKRGYEIIKYKKNKNSLDPNSEIKLNGKDIVDLESLANIALTIPGMISPTAGQLLYTLCYMQVCEGDVVEVGSWQGRSSSFLARAVKFSGNGSFYAIDHFKGNAGKEQSYIVNNKDLSDLKQRFISNMTKIDLYNDVNLLDMPNEEAVNILNESKIRFLFIDGDHTEQGVKRDIELFVPKLVEGGIIVFDDFSKGFSGLIKSVERFVKNTEVKRIMSYKNTLVVMV